MSHEFKAKITFRFFFIALIELADVSENNASGHR